MGDTEALAKALLSTLADRADGNDLVEAVSAYHQASSAAGYLQVLGLAPSPEV
jgi:hypothetical protein